MAGSSWFRVEVLKGCPMDKVADYFDDKADGWAEMENSTRSCVQPAVAATAGVVPGSRVLDVGCGLGVMVPVYQERGATHVLCIDVSEKMIELARERWSSCPEIECQVADVVSLDAPGQFDAVVIYNAYPHIMDREALVSNVYSLLADGGRFVVAHGSGKDEINSHHAAVAAGVSLGLRPAAEEAAAWEGLFVVDAVVDTPLFFAFSGYKRK